jgi:hypothetical protein
MADDLDDFLAHYGVKGMKWGVRKAEGSSGSSPTRRPISPEAKAHAKYISKELAFGSIGPAAMLMGAGPPISIALGISVGVLRSPPVSNAIKQSSKATAELMKEIGDTKLSAMREAREAKADLRAAAKTVNDDLIKQLA